MTDRRALPGWAQDLAVDGIGGNALTRHDVVRAVRQIMLSAHRAGLSWADVHAMLTDRKRYRLAAQIGTGRGQRAISPKAVTEILDRHWRETGAVAADRPAWERDDVLAFIEAVQENLDHADLSDLDRSILQVVVDLANQHGTSRPAVPVRTVVERLGLDPERSRDLMKVQRSLKRLTTDGDWIALAKAGNPGTRRANLYNLAPALAATYTGATPPRSHPAPMSHPPMSHEGADVMPLIATHVAVEDWEEFLEWRRLRNVSLTATGGHTPANVIPLRKEA